MKVSLVSKRLCHKNKLIYIITIIIYFEVELYYHVSFKDYLLRQSSWQFLNVWVNLE
jgi:hypothetical protein